MDRINKFNTKIPKYSTTVYQHIADGIPPLTAAESRVDADDHEVLVPSKRLEGLILL